MSFDFGDSNKASDPTADFTSKFPSLDGDDGDAVLSGAGGGAGAGGVAPALDDFEDDLLGGGGAAATSADEQPKGEREQFESQFPELDDPDIGGGAAAIEPQSTSYNGNSYLPPPTAASNTHIAARGPSPQAFGTTTLTTSYDHESDEEEPEPLREWRHKQADEIARRDAEAERKKGEAISQAERDIDQFYSEYNAKKEKSIKKNKEDEAAFLEKRQQELAEGTTWDRITKLIDLQNSQSKTIAPTGPGSTDLSRFREILLSLRREGESAPAAGGY